MPQSFQCIGFSHDSISHRLLRFQCNTNLPGEILSRCDDQVEIQFLKQFGLTKQMFLHMKNLLFLAIGILMLSACGKDVITDDSKDRTISYEVDGDLITFGAEDIFINAIFGIFSVGATDGDTNTSAMHSIDLTWIETPTVGMYSDTSGVSNEVVYNGDSNFFASENVVVNVTENSDDYFRATFSWDDTNGLQTVWEIRNGKIVIEK